MSLKIHGSDDKNTPYLRQSCTNRQYSANGPGPVLPDLTSSTCGKLAAAGLMHQYDLHVQPLVGRCYDSRKSSIWPFLRLGRIKHEIVIIPLGFVYTYVLSFASDQTLISGIAHFAIVRPTRYTERERVSKDKVEYGPNPHHSGISHPESFNRSGRSSP